MWVTRCDALVISRPRVDHATLVCLLPFTRDSGERETKVIDRSAISAIWSTMAGDQAYTQGCAG